MRLARDRLHQCQGAAPRVRDFGRRRLILGLPFRARLAPCIRFPIRSTRYFMSVMEQADPEVWRAIEGERRREQDGVEMIGPGNYASPAVLAAQGSVLTNKYAEGYPGRRYYGGCEFVDVAEQLAIDRLLKLFGAERANVQPHSGAQANMAVYLAALQPGD